MLKQVYKAAVPAALRIRMRHRFDDLFCRPGEDKQTFGTRCPWTVLTRGLGPDSVVYSGGVGEDISFELDLINRFGVTIQLFDPSPMALHTLSTVPQTSRKALRFKPLGLAARSQPMGFSPLGGVMGHFGKGSAVYWNCTSLRDEMTLNGHDRIDLLKLDIEGFEYEVLEGCLRDRVFPQQLCVEFHNFMGAGRWRDTVALLLKMRRFGYRIVHKNQYDYTLRHDPGGC